MGSVGLHGRECWVTWWIVLGYMVESARFRGGEFWVTWWRVLGYMVESARLHGGECWVISVKCWVTW